MKTWLSVMLCGIFAFPVFAAADLVNAGQQTSSSPASNVPSPTPYAVVNRDANSSIWEQTTYERSPSGEVVSRKHSYTELATGLNYLKDGQWVESKEEIDIQPDGTACATQGQHQAYFPGDIYEGQIELVTPDGQHLKSRPLGLSYDDGTNTVLIAELTNSVGYLVGSNQVIYPDAFTGFKADLLYTYTKAGFEQDVILRQQPPAPEDFNLASQNTRLQLMTEFFNPPQPSIAASQLPAQSGMTLNDDNLDFGVMKMVLGKAFLLGSDAHEAGTLVGKEWVNISGRQILVEQVPVMALADDLLQLPMPQNNSTKVSPPLHVVSTKRLLPAQHVVKTDNRSVFMAKLVPASKGLVLDYTTLNSSLTNYTFQGDTTYYISGNVNLYGTNTFEGGTVIKYTNSTSAEIILNGVVNCLTGPDTPAIFTAKDDDSVGEVISGSTGSPSGNYAQIALDLARSPSDLKYLRFAYANTGVEPAVCNVTMEHSQFVHVAAPFVAIEGELDLENVLVYNAVGTVFAGYEGSFTAQNLTVHDANTLCGSGSLLHITNSLFICVTNWGSSFASVKNATNSSDAGVFETAGGALHYLATSSPYRNAGTTNIDPGLLTEIQTMTTYAPQDGGFPDTNTPDLGYHYSVNEDSDYDGIPDWWIWKNFGNYDENGTTLDSSGNTLLYDYQNGLDPNVISFSIVVTNNYINSTGAPVQLNVTAGVPSYFAVLVDSTNFAGATWNTYTSSNITVYLGSVQGWHDVWVGLRGLPSNAMQAWQWKHLNLTLPPVLVITNPVAGVVDEPMIQIYGYCQDSLASISYDIRNAVGVATNQPSEITDQYYDTNALGFTTNYFECLDVPLTNGLNTITIHATDLAGDTTTTNFNFTLDYSSKTNPPVMQITWPQNGTQISGSNFTCRGAIDDPTATVATQLVFTNGNTNVFAGGIYTNVYAGEVERNGNFWLENLPINTGTNAFTITVTDAVGNTSVTNISLVQSTLVLTVNPVTPDSQLWQPTVNLTGTISISTYAVWVNGVKGHNNGDGTWSANNVPVNDGGTASFTATAYAPTEQQPDGSYGN